MTHTAMFIGFNKYYPSSYDDLMYELDVDDTGSYGPETITLLKEQSGDYTLSMSTIIQMLFMIRQMSWVSPELK